MNKKHEVNIMVSKPDCNEQSVIKTRKCRMREWLIRRLFGDAREIFVLSPGETVEIVAIMENGTNSMYVKRTQKPKEWMELLQIVRDVAADPSVCKTLVIDTGDRAEALCVRYICQKCKTDGLESFGYGKGYVYFREEFKNLLNELDKVIAARVNVVICCHTQIKKFELPDEAGGFDRYELKMSKNVSPLVGEWCDIQLFANFKTYVVATENKNRKGMGGTKHVMYASHTASWDAKNRHGLPDEMELDFKYIARLFGEVAPVQQDATPLEQLKALMEKFSVTEAELQKVVADKDKYLADTPVAKYDGKIITGWVIKYWDQIMPLITSNRNTNEPQGFNMEKGGN